VCQRHLVLQAANLLLQITNCLLLLCRLCSLQCELTSSKERHKISQVAKAIVYYQVFMQNKISDTFCFCNTFMVKITRRAIR